MADSKMSGEGFVERLWNSASIAGAYLAGYLGATNIRITLDEIKKYVLGSATREIGRNNSGDIVTIDGIQQLTDKILIYPGINSPDKITATSEDINKLDGCNATTINLNQLAGVEKNIQTQLDNISSSIPGVLQRVYVYSYTFLAQGIQPIIPEDIIRASVTPSYSEPTGYFYRVDHKTMCMTLLQKQNTGEYKSMPLAADITPNRSNTPNYLNKIFVTVPTDGKYYLLIIHFKLSSYVSSPTA